MSPDHGDSALTRRAMARARARGQEHGDAADGPDARAADGRARPAADETRRIPGNDAGSAQDKELAPEPDDPTKPSSPARLTGPVWRYALRRTLREAMADAVPDLGAALTYWAVLAVAPSLLALVSMLGLLGDPEQIVERVMTAAENLAPGTSVAQVQAVVDAVLSRENAGWGLVLGLAVALWSASGYVNAFGRAMNRIYEVDEGRPFWKLRPTMILVTLVMLLLGAGVVVALVLSGGAARWAGALVGLSDQAVQIWDVAKWPVVAVLIVLIVAVLYYATPNVRQPRFRWLSPGAVLAIVVWAAATAAFGFYVGNVGNYQATYGALAGFVVFLLWIWLTNLALLIGAELDAELERARELQAGIAAEETIQLPPRDTRASAKRRDRAAEDVRLGRALRASHGRTTDPPRDAEAS